MKRTIVAIIAVSLVGYFAVRIPGTGYTLFELERSGRVPDGANERTWRACESTFWWGRRLDPDAFWSNRVVWLSREVEIAANRQGRRFPPIPSGDNRFSERSDRDHAPLVTWDGIIRAYHSTERESAYWDWFGKHMPRPPDKIDRVLEQAVVSEPSDEEIRVTTGWRVDYLRRLRREGTDESYIEAYKKAWNLSEDDLKEAAE